MQGSHNFCALLGDFIQRLLPFYSSYFSIYLILRKLVFFYVWGLWQNLRLEHHIYGSGQNTTYTALVLIIYRWLCLEHYIHHNDLVLVYQHEAVLLMWICHMRIWWDENADLYAARVLIVQYSFTSSSWQYGRLGVGVVRGCHHI